MIGRRRVSLLVKIMSSLVLCLLIASVLTSALETRLTRSALRGESGKQTRSQLLILGEAFRARERALDVVVGNLTSELTTRGLTAPAERGELEVALGVAHENRELDLLEVLDLQGTRPVPATGLATLADAPRVVREAKAPGLTSQLLAVTPDGYAQAVVRPAGRGPDLLLVAAGDAFDDPFAYQLRSQIGDLAEVMLVVGDRVVGTTLPQHPRTPPAFVTGARLPASPTVADVGGVDMLVAYAPVAIDGEGVPSGAIGVALVDPTASLDASLAHSRALTSVILGLVAVIVGWLLFRALVRPLAALDRTATRIAAGDLEASFDIKGHDEIARLGHSLSKMTSESRAQAQRVADASRRIVTAQDDERRRMERDLHDGAQQRLLTASLAVGVAKAARAARDDPSLAATLEEVTRHLDAALAELRELARGIHPAILSEAGLGPALESLAEKSLVPATVTEPFTERLAAPVEATAYYVVSEAIVNATKHARASGVGIHASRVDGRLVVVVSDDGVGGAEPSGGSGLLGLSDRLAALGGTLTIDSPPGGGTRIVADLPCG